MAAPAETRTPNLHRANNRSSMSADGRVATVTARLRATSDKQKPERTNLTLTGLLMEGVITNSEVALLPVQSGETCEKRFYDSNPQGSTMQGPAWKRGSGASQSRSFTVRPIQQSAACRHGNRRLSPSSRGSESQRHSSSLRARCYHQSCWRHLKRRNSLLRHRGVAH